MSNGRPPLAANVIHIVWRNPRGGCPSLVDVSDPFDIGVLRGADHAIRQAHCHAHTLRPHIVTARRDRA